MGAAARRAVADVQGALSLSVRPADAWMPPVLALSSATGEGMDALLDAVEAHRAWAGAPGRAAASRSARHRHWVVDAVKVAFGTRGLAAVDPDAALAAEGGPFAAIARLTASLSERLP